MRNLVLSILFTAVILLHVPQRYGCYSNYTNSVAYNYMAWRQMNNYYRPPVQHFRPLPRNSGMFYNPYMGYKFDLRPHPFGGR